jgi:hypothetical protein
LNVLGLRDILLFKYVHPQITADFLYESRYKIQEGEAPATPILACSVGVFSFIVCCGLAAHVGYKKTFSHICVHLRNLRIINISFETPTQPQVPPDPRTELCFAKAPFQAPTYLKVPL